jgi:excisionase family DNA binding protein
MESTNFYLGRQQYQAVEPLALRPRDAARALGVSPSTLERIRKAGKIPHIKIGNVVLYRVESLREWLKEREGPRLPSEGT